MANKSDDTIKIIVVQVIIVILVLFVGINIGINLQKSEALNKAGMIENNALLSTKIITPAPLKGPGIYACDPFGICNNYGDEQRKSCPVTFADSHCLGQCKDSARRCTR